MSENVNKKGHRCEFFSVVHDMFFKIIHNEYACKIALCVISNPGIPGEKSLESTDFSFRLRRNLSDHWRIEMTGKFHLSFSHYASKNLGWGLEMTPICDFINTLTMDDS